MDVEPECLDDDGVDEISVRFKKVPVAGCFAVSDRTILTYPVAFEVAPFSVRYLQRPLFVHVNIFREVVAYFERGRG